MHYFVINAQLVMHYSWQLVCCMCVWGGINSVCVCAFVSYSLVRGPWRACRCSVCVNTADIHTSSHRRSPCLQLGTDSWEHTGQFSVKLCRTGAQFSSPKSKNVSSYVLVLPLQYVYMQIDVLFDSLTFVSEYVCSLLGILFCFLSKLIECYSHSTGNRTNTVSPH